MTFSQDLPNWTEAPLIELLSVLETGARPKGGVDRYKTGIPSIGGEHLTESGKFNLQNLKFIPEDFAENLLRGKISPGDVLIVKDGATTGKCVLVPEDFLLEKAYVNEHIFLCRFWPTLDSRFFAYFLRSDQGQKRILANFRGAAQGGIPQSFADKTLVCVAPIREQIRISTKLDELLARVDACQEHLERVQEIIKQFRQAVLIVATSGQLTKEWRIQNGFGTTDDKETKTFDFFDADCFGNYEFPSTWKRKRLMDIADITGGITKDSKRQNLADEEIPYLRVANVQRGYLDLSEIKTIRVPNARLNDWLLKPGDILFNEGGDLDKLGRGCVWNGEIERCIFQNHVFRARLKDSSNIPNYFSYYGNSRGFDYFLMYGKQTTNLASINKTVLEALPIAVPPIDEQSEIVRRVESLFAYADQFEARYSTGKDLIGGLTPTLLTKAFRGELVSQDPVDEPAFVLLERIQAQRATQPEKPKGRAKMKSIKIQKTEIHLSIVDALQQFGKEISSEQLFLAAGYPVDAESELIEEFFVDIRDALKSGQIRKRREDDTDWFSVNKE